MKRLGLRAAAVLLAASIICPIARLSAGSAGQSPTTVTGRISDSLCKAKHEEAAEGAGKMTDHDCTVSCVRGGSKYVLLVDGKVMQIANQNQRDLEKFAGQTVSATGELKGDTITISAIAAR